MNRTEQSGALKRLMAGALAAAMLLLTSQALAAEGTVISGSLVLR